MTFLVKNLILLLSSIFIYLYFRGAIFTYFRMSNISKSSIKKHQHGIWNRLFYTQLHKKNMLGNLYYLNITYLCLVLTFSVIVVFSSVSFLQIIIVALGMLLGIAMIPVWIVSLMYYNLEQFGRKFVLIRIYKSNDFKRRGISSILDWLIGLLPLAVYVLLLLKAN